MGILNDELNRIHHGMAKIAAKYFGDGEEMAEEFRTPWLSDAVDLIKRDSTNRIIVGNKEFVQVVRCKDCKWQELCKKTLEYKGADGYCSKGERSN